MYASLLNSSPIGSPQGQGTAHWRHMGCSRFPAYTSIIAAGDRFLGGSNALIPAQVSEAPEQVGPEARVQHIWLPSKSMDGVQELSHRHS
mmetsp:Transcript_42642/g.120504  ORF Transcript_42642/g.120504 Transcript_42642/m.120504 type:complete len:90 (-) Transcript_42642:9-278(-)